MSSIRLTPPTTWGGDARIPGDKSVSHRALILAALARGTSTIVNIGRCADVAATVTALKSLGVKIEPKEGELRVEGVGLRGLQEPEEIIDCQNSGTTARLLAGVLAGSGIRATLDGDDSLRQRPMARVTAPLADLGWPIYSDSDRLPIETGIVAIGEGSHPAQQSAAREVRVVLKTASAQVKSAILLAALTSGRPIEVVEPNPSRDHTERMIRALGGRCISSSHYLGSSEALNEDEAPWTRYVPGGRLTGRRIQVPGDISSASFLLAAASLGGVGVNTGAVGLNPGRVGFLEALVEMGGQLQMDNRRVLTSGEPVASLSARPAKLKGLEIGPSLIPRLIDELPIIAVLGAAAEGQTRVWGAAELRVKESDRLKGITSLLRALNVEVEESEDGFSFQGLGEASWAGFSFDSMGDHRLAMAAAIAALPASSPSTIKGSDSVAVSWPEFWEVLRGIGVESEPVEA